MKAIISPNIRVRHPEHFEIGDYSIVDDYCYFSARVRVGRCCHITSGVSVIGGRESRLVMADYTNLGNGSRIVCSSDDCNNDWAGIPPAQAGDFKKHVITGDVALERFVVVGTNAVVMPGNHLPEGAIVGALSFVPPRFPFEPWSIYAGSPIRLIKRRNRESVLEQCNILERRMGWV